MSWDPEAQGVGQPGAIISRGAGVGGFADLCAYGLSLTPTDVASGTGNLQMFWDTVAHGNSE